MSTVKITELVDLTIPANTQNVVLVAVDKSTTNPVTRKVTMSDVGNVINQVAFAAFNQANTALDAANTAPFAYGQANTATTDAARADQRAVTSGDYANSAFSLANAASIYVESGGVYANGAYTKANVASIDALSAGNFANSAFSAANGSMLQALTSNLTAQSAYTLANTAWYDGNNAFIQANTANVHAVSAFNTANLAVGYALSSNINSLIITASAPATPTGNTGDASGMVYLSNIAFYYCTADYDGSTNIWSKIVSTDTW